MQVSIKIVLIMNAKQPQYLMVKVYVQIPKKCKLQLLLLTQTKSIIFLVVSKGPMTFYSLQKGSHCVHPQWELY